MSVIVQYSTIDGDKVKVTIPYEYGEYALCALHLTCGAEARKYGERYIKNVLEKDRIKNSNQGALF